MAEEWSSKMSSERTMVELINQQELPPGFVLSGGDASNETIINIILSGIVDIHEHVFIDFSDIMAKKILRGHIEDSDVREFCWAAIHYVSNPTNARELEVLIAIRKMRDSKEYIIVGEKLNTNGLAKVFSLLSMDQTKLETENSALKVYREYSDSPSRTGLQHLIEQQMKEEIAYQSRILVDLLHKYHLN